MLPSIVKPKGFGVSHLPFAEIRSHFGPGGIFYKLKYSIKSFDQIPSVVSDPNDVNERQEEFPGQFSYRALRYFSNDPTPKYIRGNIGPFSVDILQQYLLEKQPLTLELFESYAFKFACKSMVDELDRLVQDLQHHGLTVSPYILNMKIFCQLLRVPKDELTSVFGSNFNTEITPSLQVQHLKGLFQDLSVLKIPLEICIYERLAYVFFKCKAAQSISTLIVNMKIKLLQPTSLIYYYWLYLLSADKNSLLFQNAYRSIKGSSVLNEDIRKLYIVWCCSVRDMLTIIESIDGCIKNHLKPSFFVTLALGELIRGQRREDAISIFNHYTRDPYFCFSSNDLTLLLDSCIHTASFELCKTFLPLVLCKETGCPLDPDHDGLVLKIYSQSDPSKIVSFMGSLRIARNWGKLDVNNINLVLDACYKNPILNHYMFDVLEAQTTTLYSIYEAKFSQSTNFSYARFFEAPPSKLFDTINIFRNRMKLVDERFYKDSLLYELACLNVDPFIFRILLLMAQNQIEPTKTTILIIFYYYVNVRANIRELARFYHLVKPFLNDMYYGAINSLFSSCIRNKCWHTASSLFTYINLRGLPLKAYNLNICKRSKDIRYTAFKYQISCDTQKIYSLLDRIKRQFVRENSQTPRSYIERHGKDIVRIFTLERLRELSDKFAQHNIIYVAQLNDLHQDQRKILFSLSSGESFLLTRLLMVPDLETPGDSSSTYKSKYFDTQNAN
ncbi:hypothetical protein DI09_101p20 [Mitosporidium daphniae]|uniref:Uncharacterized protein n=1 Tax=Mitosporidium daphniae TaxID=1485682 RepID=A0A098VWB3_9MICR|nr:uncharacterized protein DI09_101p20 [Mitosporidium daphniae]KGG53227.1 hypothetical protein DI09_101p20 [Mitosporidium daphniae]|eukprot:XP_013239663.1 uncharacterized protein DI09_101p20 [Mitosporidium daphniae]